jgi:hypothetical protein
MTCRSKKIATFNVYGIGIGIGIGIDIGIDFTGAIGHDVDGRDDSSMRRVQ